MIKEGKIGVHEAICLVTITMSNQIFFTAPTVVAQNVGTAGWYMTFISNIVSIIAFTFIYLLLKRFPGKGILQIFDITFGRILGFVFSFIYAASCLVAPAILMREFVDVLKVFILPLTPISLITAAVTIAAIISAFLGLESIARISKLSAYICLAGYMAVLLLSVNEYDFSNLFPVLGYGIGTTIKEGISRSSVFSEVILVSIFAGSLQGIKYVKKIGYASIIISGLIISTGIFCMTLVFPYPVLQEMTSPVYNLTRIIKFGIFVQRLDPLFIFLWNITTIISISILFYTSVSIFCKTFRLQDKGPIIIPLAVILFSLTMTITDISNVMETYIEILRYYGVVLFYVLPAIALIVAIIRKKKGAGFSA
jgi:spore germination protein (amino acid permease)